MPDTLTDAEHKSFVNDLTPIALNTIHSLIELADKHNIDRNDVMEYFSALFSTMAHVATFAHYEEGGDSK